MQSCVYVLSNPSMPGLFKIGFTTKTPEIRAKQLYKSTSMPSPFEVEAYWSYVDQHDGRNMEEVAHSAMSFCRVGNSEFFRLSVPESFSSLTTALGKPEFVAEWIRAKQSETDSIVDDIDFSPMEKEVV